MLLVMLLLLSRSLSLCAEIHDYEPTPQDIVKAQSADLVLWNGMNLERWFERFFTQVKDKPAVVVTKGIDPISIYEGPYKGMPNPHAWMSTKNALVYIENIREALVKYDPKNADTYNANAKAYADKIVALDAPLRAELEKVPASQRWLVTSEGAFSYLAHDYGFKELYLWPINAEEQGTPKQIKNVIKKYVNTKSLLCSAKAPFLISQQNKWLKKPMQNTVVYFM